MTAMTLMVGFWPLYAWSDRYFSANGLSDNITILVDMQL